MAQVLRPDDGTADSGLSKPALSRRGLLRGAAATGIVAVTGAAVMSSAPNAHAAQAGWRWCNQCQGLWFANNSYPRWCPTVLGQRREHSLYGSGSYVVKFASEGGRGQDGWRWCVRCNGLWYTLNGGGACAGNYNVTVLPDGTYWYDTGGPHTPSLPGAGYRVEVHWSNDGPGGQEGWRHCKDCQVLWFGPNAASDYCAHNGYSGHNALGSGYYKLRFGRSY